MNHAPNEPGHAPTPAGRSVFLGSLPGRIGLAVLALVFLLCTLTLPWTLSSAGRDPDGRPLPPRYRHGELTGFLLPPSWAPMNADERARYTELARERALNAARTPGAITEDPEGSAPPEPTGEVVNAHRPFFLLGTDRLGRDLLIRCLAGGGVSIGIGLAAAAISVVIGTLYGAAAGYAGGRVDALMMRIVDVLYGLPYILLVVLLAVAGDALLHSHLSRQPARDAFVAQRLAAVAAERGLPSAGAARASDPALYAAIVEESRDRHPPRNIGEGTRAAYEVGVLLVAIGGVSWLTMARVIRGQVLSLKARPFMEAARAVGVPLRTIFARHLLPNLLAPIIVYATLTVPQAILQESFLSFLGIGVRPPLPSWGGLAAEGLIELNPVRVRWWLIVFPCLLLALTLLALNFVGEGLREAMDPRRRSR